MLFPFYRIYRIASHLQYKGPPPRFPRWRSNDLIATVHRPRPDQRLRSFRRSPHFGDRIYIKPAPMSPPIAKHRFNRSRPFGPPDQRSILSCGPIYRSDWSEPKYYRLQHIKVSGPKGAFDTAKWEGSDIPKLKCYKEELNGFRVRKGLVLYTP